jgi:hypothetical protein
LSNTSLAVSPASPADAVAADDGSRADDLLAVVVAGFLLFFGSGGGGWSLSTAAAAATLLLSLLLLLLLLRSSLAGDVRGGGDLERRIASLDDVGVDSIAALLFFLGGRDGAGATSGGTLTGDAMGEPNGTSSMGVSIDARIDRKLATVRWFFQSNDTG